MLMICWSSVAIAQKLICSSGNISISGSNRTDVIQTCRAVKDALPFLKNVGLKLPTDVKINVVSNLLAEDSEQCELARYDGHQCAILILEFNAACKAAERVSSQPLMVAMNRPLWRSYVVHELTHAAIHASCGQVCPDRAAHEYIAAVAQISSMPAHLRREILGSYRKLEGFSNKAEISEIYYALNPCQFMVKSYLHYIKPGNGHRFIRSLLEPAASRLKSE